MVWFIGFHEKRVFIHTKKKVYDELNEVKYEKLQLGRVFWKVKIYTPSASGMNDTSERKKEDMQSDANECLCSHWRIINIFTSIHSKVNKQSCWKILHHKKLHHVSICDVKLSAYNSIFT